MNAPGKQAIEALERGTNCDSALSALAAFREDAKFAANTIDSLVNIAGHSLAHHQIKAAKELTARLRALPIPPEAEEMARNDARYRYAQEHLFVGTLKDVNSLRQVHWDNAAIDEAIGK